MAKKRKEKGEEEELDFKIPKFDEEKFINKERRNIKTAFISFFYGLLMALICFGFWALMGPNTDFRWHLVFLVMFVNIVFIKVIFQRLNIDLTDFGRKGWFTSGATYFFTWLLVFIVIVNPPFYDEESPVIEAVALPGMQEFGGTVKIVAKITDNLDVDTTSLNIVDPDGTNHTITDFTYSDNIFQFEYENTDNLVGEFSYFLTAIDVNKKISTVQGTFTYGNNTIVLTTPDNGSELHSYTPVEFKINGDVFEPIPFYVEGKLNYMDFRMFYKINDNIEINVNRLDDDKRDIYRTTAEYQGWTPGVNTTIRGCVEVSYYFINPYIGFNNTVQDTEVYTFETLQEAGIGTEEKLVPPNPQFSFSHEQQVENPLNYYLPAYKSIMVPGFEILTLLVSILVVALIFKYKKKDKRKQK